MYRSHIFALILLSAISLQGIAQNIPSPQQSTDITDRELFRMLRGGTYENSRALDYIGKIYSKNFNNGIVPERDTLWAFADIIEHFMFNPPGRKWDVPAEGLVIEALKEVAAQIKEQRPYWDNAYKAAESYFSQPSPDNAEKFCMALPDKRIPTFDYDGKVRLSELIFDFMGRKLRISDPPAPDLRKNFSIIEKNMDQGEPYAVGIMFRLFNLSDGAVTETICFVLGELISKHPRLFLQKLLIHEAKTEQTAFNHSGCILRMVTEWGEIPEAGNDPVKYKEIYNARLARRIKALESVDDPDLKEIRDRCLSILKKEKDGTTSRPLLFLPSQPLVSPCK